jgi:hypothetical protein
MNENINETEPIKECVVFGRNKYKFKYIVSFGDMTKKYCSVVDIINDPSLSHFDLNRQKVYRIRKGHYSNNKGTSAHALHKKGYARLIIESINEPRKFKTRVIRELI